MSAAIGIVSRSTTAGRAFGRTSASTDTTTSARPNPTDPCTMAPNQHRHEREEQLHLSRAPRGTGERLRNANDHRVLAGPLITARLNLPSGLLASRTGTQ